MKIAIQPVKGSFSDYWIKYCEIAGIDYKIVDCYKNSIISEISDCNALMWHFYHNNSKDFLFAKQLLISIEYSGKVVFPDSSSNWHFDDKVGQKYLLESIKAPLVDSFVFYTKDDALKWVANTTFPKVFKLRGGAGSVNVKLVKNKQEAIKLIYKAFGKGFKHDSLIPLSELYQKFSHGKVPFWSVIKGCARIFLPTKYSKVHGRERGYIYFQEFIPNNEYDIRVIVIDNKAFAIKRLVRPNDFRASGSGNILYEKKLFDEKTLKISFEMANKLKSQCIAFDYVYQNNRPLVVEISYGFSPAGYLDCPGYWDSKMKWHEGKFNPYGWMVERVVADCQ